MKLFHPPDGRVHLAPSARLRRRLSRRWRGQALIEAALVMSALLVITIGLIQYGILYNATGTLTHLAREGARFAGIHAMDSSTTVNSVTTGPDAATRNYIRLKAQSSSITPSSLTDASIAITPATGNTARTSGQPITVTITYDLRRKIFLGSKFPGMSRFVGAQAITMTHVIE